MGKRLDDAIKKIENMYGKNTLYKYGDSGTISDVSTISTGSFGLNNALGIGGYPRGRIIEIFGPESSGKTTLALHAVAEAQKIGLEVAFIDVEHALDPEYARNIGVNVKKLLISQPDHGEQALELIDELVKTGEMGCVVLDSVAGLVPKEELEGSMSDQQMGLQARLMGKALRKLTGTVKKSDCALIFINQLREKMGVQWGNPESTPGGRALKFYASIRLDARRVASVKDGDEVVANRTKVKVVKNKMAPPFKKVEFDIRFGEGIDKYGELVDYAKEFGIVEKTGNSYSFENNKIGIGREKTIRFLKENEDVFLNIREQLFGE